MRLTWIAVFFILLKVEIAETSGTLSMRFVKFRNPGSRTKNGRCCDNINFCISSCEVFIQFCMTLRSRSSSCSIMDFETPTLGDDSFDFQNNLGNGRTNPVIYSFDQWTEPLVTKLKVLDDDGKNPLGIGRKADLISSHDVIISSKPGTNQVSAAKHSRILRGYRSELYIEFKVYCDNGYFKPTCKEYCNATNDQSGHYTCDFENSRRVCLPNWYGTKCTTFCKPNSDNMGHYICSDKGDKICHSNWHGTYCNTFCYPSDDLSGHYTCDGSGKKVCLENWFGDNCTIYCKTNDKYNCSANGGRVCSRMWYGINCTQYCNASNTGNFKCDVNGTIICAENWYDTNCNRYCTPRNEKAASYSCSDDGRKVCYLNWYGTQCDVYCRKTATSSCNEKGSKVCHKDWFGPKCSRYCEASQNSSLSYHCDENGTKICNRGWFGDRCSIFTGCTESIANASRYYCDKKTGEMVCKLGWTGNDCNFDISSSSRSIDHLTSPSRTKLYFELTTKIAVFATKPSVTISEVSTQWEVPSEYSKHYISKTRIKMRDIQSTISFNGNKRLSSVVTTIRMDGASVSPSNIYSIMVQNRMTRSEKIAINKGSISASISATTDDAFRTRPPNRSEAISRKHQKNYARQTRIIATTSSISIRDTKQLATLIASHRNTKIANSLQISASPSSFYGISTKLASMSYKSANENTANSSVIRSEVSNEKSRASFLDASKIDASKIDASKIDASKIDASKIDASKIDASKIDASKIDASKIDASKIDASKLDASKIDASKIDASKIDASKIVSSEELEGGKRPAQDGAKNLRYLFYAGVPLCICSIVLAILAAKSKGLRVSSSNQSKVKQIRITSELSDPEKKSLLRSVETANHSVTILPIILSQAAKKNGSVISHDEIYTY